MKNRLQNRPFIISVLLISQFVFSNAQQPGYITGKVINSVSLEPIVFASLGLKNNRIGVFANAEGDFKISNSINFQRDSLIVTSIGFNRTAIAFRDLNATGQNMLKLSPAVVPISEVFIMGSYKKLNPRAIIRKAISRIHKNYLVKPYSYISYYRDYQKQGKEYINLNEAIIETNDPGFNSASEESVSRLFDFRKNHDFRRMFVPPYYDNIENTENENLNKYMPGFTVPDYGGNELIILSAHDAIRNYKIKTYSFINTLSNDFLPNHIFEEVKPIYNNNILLYKIKFKARPSLASDSLVFAGEIFIHSKDFSIYKLEYGCYYITRSHERKQLFLIKTEYGKDNTPDSLMGLKYISFSNIFNLVDAEDTSYFKIVNSDVANMNSNLTFEFNHTVDKESGSKRENYNISYKNKYKSYPVRISNLEVKNNTVIIKLKDSSITDRHYVVNIKNLKDIDGHYLNKRKTIEYYQYREQFVQKYTKPEAFQDSCIIKNIPLKENSISKGNGDKEYWMNTPENIQMER
jgi:hypothetical protein